MKILTIFLFLFFVASPSFSTDKSEEQVLIACTQISDSIIGDLNLGIPGDRAGAENYVLLVFDNNIDPAVSIHNHRAVSSATAFFFNGSVYKFRANLISTIEDDLSITASKIHIYMEDGGPWYKHGEFHAYNIDSGQYKNLDYISPLGKVYKLKAEPYRNEECESKFRGVNIVSDNKSSAD